MLLYSGASIRAASSRARECIPAALGLYQKPQRASDAPSRRRVKVLPPLLHARAARLRARLLAMGRALRTTDPRSRCTGELMRTSRLVSTRHAPLDPLFSSRGGARVGSASPRAGMHTPGPLGAIRKPLEASARLRRPVGGARSAQRRFLGVCQNLEAGHDR